MLSFLQRWRRRPKAWSDDDHILAYLEGRENETDIASLNLDSEAKAEYRAELSSLRETVALLRSLDAVEAKGSFVLTAENLSRRGYNDRQIESILAPRRTSSWSRTGIGRVPVYVPAAISVIALLGVAMLAIGDIREYVSDNLLNRSETQMEVVVRIESAGDPGQPGGPGETVMPGETGRPSLKSTVVVEKERTVKQAETVVVLQEVPVEKRVEVEKEVVVEIETVASEAGDTPEEDIELGTEAVEDASPSRARRSAAPRASEAAQAKTDSLAIPEPEPTRASPLQESAVMDPTKEVVVEIETVASEAGDTPEEDIELGTEAVEDASPSRARRSAAPRASEAAQAKTDSLVTPTPTVASRLQESAVMDPTVGTESEPASEGGRRLSDAISESTYGDDLDEDAGIEDRGGSRFRPLLFVFLAGLLTAIAFWIFVTRIKSIK